MNQPRRPRRPPGQPLAGFLADSPTLALPERAALVETATALLSGAYVHLRQKQARYGIDPVQQLRVLEERLTGLTPHGFQNEFGIIFTALRDRHTGYLAPPPFAGKTAVLPLLVERYHSPGGAVRHVISKLADWCPHTPGFTAGVQVTHWNGTPIERAVEQAAEHQRGATDDARLTRGLNALVARSLEHGPPPDEEWVTITYRHGRGIDQHTIHWRVIDTSTHDATSSGDTADTALTLAQDPDGQAVQAARRALYAPRTPADPWVPTSRPKIFAARPLTRRLGYLRVWSFADPDAAAVREEASRLTTLLPPNGLIVDLRGNPGGNVPTAEQLLQVFTARHITPAGFSLANTPLTLAMSRADPDQLGRWTPSLELAVGTGEPYSQALPLTSEAHANDLPPARRYPGPVVVIIDALTYSAADIFAAGFQDNQIGPILGTSATTGAGGANVWTAAQIAQRLGDLDHQPMLPTGGGSFTIAIRRATRVGLRAGLPLEDIGVIADTIHQLTRTDLTDSNRDLLRAAADLLGPTA
jgi:Peptidase family S41